MFHHYKLPMRISNSPSALAHRVNQITAFCMFTNQIGPLIFICCGFRSVSKPLYKTSKAENAETVYSSHKSLLTKLPCVSNHSMLSILATFLAHSLSQIQGPSAGVHICFSALEVIFSLILPSVPNPDHGPSSFHYV